MLDQDGRGGDQQQYQYSNDPYADPYGQGGDDLVWEDDAEYVTSRPAFLRVIRAAVAIVILAGIGFVIFGVARSWFSAQIDPEGEPGQIVTVNIPSGASTGDIAVILEGQTVIPNSTFFRYYAEWKGEGNFKAGEYAMQENMSADQAIAVLNGGPKQIEYGEFIVPEGLWLNEMLPRIAEQIPGVTEAELWAALESGQLQPRYRPAGETSWEGLLFPAKYFIEEDITGIEVLGKMNDEFARVTGELGYGAAEQVHDMSAYEVIIIASLVEAEARTAGDRPKIARVIYNRLRENQGLGIDATLIYGNGVRGEPILQSQLDTPGPYNTRHPESRGLPPTPIAFPSKASLEAAMNPAEGPWLWYVLADAEGNHFFTDDFDEFNTQKQLSAEAGLLG